MKTGWRWAVILLWLLSAACGLPALRPDSTPTPTPTPQPSLTPSQTPTPTPLAMGDQLELPEEVISAENAARLALLAVRMGASRCGGCGDAPSPGLSPWGSPLTQPLPRGERSSGPHPASPQGGEG